MSQEIKYYKTSYATALFLVILSYSLAFAAAWVADLYFFQSYSPLWRILFGDLIATVVIFIFSFVTNNSSFYDPYWSIIPPVIVYIMPYFYEGQAIDMTRQLVVISLVWFWGIRLTVNWWTYWSGLDHEDFRYVELRRTTGGAYWLVSFSGIHLFPTVMVFLALLPVFYVFDTNAQAFNIIDIVAIIVTGGAVVIEAVSDLQLRLYQRTNKDPQNFLKSGIWAYSRHPNYFGEISFWIGIFIFGLAAQPSSWWTGIGALAMTSMFAGISLKMIDDRMLKKRPHYADHMKKVSAIIPWFPKK